MEKHTEPVNQNSYLPVKKSFAIIYNLRLGKCFFLRKVKYPLLSFFFSFIQQTMSFQGPWSFCSYVTGENILRRTASSEVNSWLCMVQGHGCSLFVWQTNYSSLEPFKQHKEDRRIMSQFNAFYLDRKSL